MYPDEEYYEAHRIIEYNLKLVDKYEKLFPRKPSDEDIEL